MWTDDDALDYAKTLISQYGWVVASSIAEAEAKPHSPYGKPDGFWAAVSDAINSFGK